MGIVGLSFRNYSASEMMRWHVFCSFPAQVLQVARKHTSYQHNVFLSCELGKKKIMHHNWYLKTFFEGMGWVRTMRALWGSLPSMENCWQIRGFRHLFFAFSHQNIPTEKEKKESTFGQEHLLTFLNETISVSYFTHQ